MNYHKFAGWKSNNNGMTRGILLGGNQINGIIVGTFFAVDSAQSEFEKILNEYITDKPMICNVNFGHSKPIMTIPIGVRAEIDSDNLKITLLESPFESIMG